MTLIILYKGKKNKITGGYCVEKNSKNPELSSVLKKNQNRKILAYKNG